MKLGFVIPKQMSAEIEPFVTKQFTDITITYITYSSIFEIPTILSGKQSSLDMLLFLGNTAMKYTASQITPTISWQYIPHTRAALLQRLLQLTLAGQNINHITTDVQDQELIYGTYREIGIDMSKTDINITPPYTFNENFFDHTTQSHHDQYRFKKDVCCITMFYEIYRRLTELHIPAVYLTPTLSDIYAAIAKVQTEFLLQISRESQLVIVDIRIDERNAYSPLMQDEYQLTFENMSVSRKIYEFAKKVQATVARVTDTEFLLFSTRAIMANQTNRFHEFPLINEIRKNTASTISIGMGFGKTAMEAKIHARLGLDYALKGGGDQMFLVYDPETIRGPIGRNKHEPNFNFRDSFMALAETTGVNAFTLSQLHDLVIKQNRHEFTTAEIADHLGITPRTANRIIVKLIEHGCCYEVGKQFKQKNGRPSRILQLNI